MEDIYLGCRHFAINMIALAPSSYGTVIAVTDVRSYRLETLDNTFCHTGGLDSAVLNSGLTDF